MIGAKRVGENKKISDQREIRKKGRNSLIGSHIASFGVCCRRTAFGKDSFCARQGFCRACTPRRLRRLTRTLLCCALSVACVSGSASADSAPQVHAIKNYSNLGGSLNSCTQTRPSVPVAPFQEFVIFCRVADIFTEFPMPWVW